MDPVRADECGKGSVRIEFHKAVKDTDRHHIDASGSVDDQPRRLENKGRSSRGRIRALPRSAISEPSGASWTIRLIARVCDIQLFVLRLQIIPSGCLNRRPVLHS